MTDTATTTSKPRILVLIATIPSRRAPCERLLREVARQTRTPDGVILVLDGYGDTAPAPSCSLPVIAEYRTTALSGPGKRWRVTADLAPEDIVICLDDDIMLLQAPRLVAALVLAVEKSGGASCAMGCDEIGKRAPPGDFSRGEMIYAAGCGLTVRARHLDGLQAFSAEVQAAGGPDALGLCGDDDALVSAYLWKTGVKVRHAATGNIFAASGTRTTSQTAARMAKVEPIDAQKLAIKAITGWPWFVAKGGAHGSRAA